MYKTTDGNSVLRVQKRLSYVLRHGATERGIPIRRDGYVSAFDLLSLEDFRGVTFQTLCSIVYESPKRRFSMAVVEPPPIDRRRRRWTQSTAASSSIISDLNGTNFKDNALRGSALEGSASQQGNLRGSEVKGADLGGTTDQPDGRPWRASVVFEAAEFDKSRRNAGAGPVGDVQRKVGYGAPRDIATKNWGSYRRRGVRDCGSTVREDCVELMSGSRDEMPPSAAENSCGERSVDSIVLRDVDHENVLSIPTRYKLIDVYIRALQGHSIGVVESDLLLKRIESADEIVDCIHGTYWRNWNSVLKYGLRCMNRQHIHFAIGLPSQPGGTERIYSGIRRNASIAIFINVKKAMNFGIIFYKSLNNVILSSGKNGIISKNFFLKVVSLPSLKDVPIEFRQDLPIPDHPPLTNHPKKFHISTSNSCSRLPSLISNEDPRHDLRSYDSHLPSPDLHSHESERLDPLSRKHDDPRKHDHDAPIPADRGIYGLCQCLICQEHMSRASHDDFGPPSICPSNVSKRDQNSDGVGSPLIKMCDSNQSLKSGLTSSPVLPESTGYTHFPQLSSDPLSSDILNSHPIPATPASGISFGPSPNTPDELFSSQFMVTPPATPKVLHQVSDQAVDKSLSSSTSFTLDGSEDKATDAR